MPDSIPKPTSSSSVGISAVIPCYNSEKTISTAIESVLNQTVPVREIICVDDASKDGTSLVVEKLAKEATIPVILEKLKENKGPSHARNTGWRIASSKFVAFLDADDVWLPRKVEWITRYIEQYPQTTMLTHDCGNTQTVPISKISKIQKKFRHVFWRNPWKTPSWTIKRNIQPRFNSSMRYSEDYDLLLRIAAKHPIDYLPHILTRLGRPVNSSGGQSSSLLKMRLGEMRAYFHLCSENKFLAPIFPVLLAISVTKHLVKWLLRR